MMQQGFVFNVVQQYWAEGLQHSTSRFHSALTAYIKKSNGLPSRVPTLEELDMCSYLSSIADLLGRVYRSPVGLQQVLANEPAAPIPSICQSLCVLLSWIGQNDVIRELIWCSPLYLKVRPHVTNGRTTTMTETHSGKLCTGQQAACMATAMRAPIMTSMQPCKSHALIEVVIGMLLKSCLKHARQHVIHACRT